MAKDKITTGKYPWRRFWCALGGPINLDQYGYLIDPQGSHGENLNPSAFPFSALADVGCIALLGDPGSGKSVAIADIVAEIKQTPGFDENGLIDLNLRSFADGGRLHHTLFDSHKFQRWVNSTDVLYIVLDSLDECLIHNRTVASMLVDELQRYPTSRIRLRIACRAAEWPILLSKELPKLWGQDQYAEAELLPLRRVDVEMAAAEDGIDEKAFVKAVEQRALTPFAIKPISLLMLLDTFQRHRDFPASQAELYRRFCLKLCAEHSLSRLSSKATSRYAPEQLLLVAERVAALSVFGKRPNIVVERAELEVDDLLVQEIVGGTEHFDSFDVDVTAEAVQDLLKSDLFTSGPEARRCWGHWSYAEFLAAHFINRRSLTLDQIRDLVFYPEQLPGRGLQIIPPLAETAAWIATDNERLLEEIAESDPQALLRSPVLSAEPGARQSIAASILRLADEGNIIDRGHQLRSTYEVLSHAGLGEQLRPYIIDSDKCSEVRRIAIDIAEACRRTELLEDLLTVTTNESEDYEVRVQAAYAVARIGDDSARKGLSPLLSGNEDDERDDLKGCALRAMWPDHLTAEQMFSYITPPKRRSFYGAYSGFLRHGLPENLTSVHVRPALDWLGIQPEDHRLAHELRDVVGHILWLAWQNLHAANLYDEFARIVVRRRQNYDGILVTTLRKDVADIEPLDDHVRLRLAEAAIRIATTSDLRPWDLLVPELLTDRDLEWLIEKCRNTSDEEQSYIARMIRAVFDQENASDIDKVYLAALEIPALGKECAPLFETVEVSSQRADQMREQYRKNTEWQDRLKPEPATHPPMPEIASGHLGQFEGGDLSAWWRLNLNLTLEPDSDHYPPNAELESDLTALAGWKELDAPLRHRCLVAAQKYLSEADPETDQWLGTNTFHRPAAAGYRALLLLQKLAQETLNALATEVWKKWAAVTIGYPESASAEAEEPMQEIIARAYAHAPAEICDSLLRMIERENAERGYVFVLRKVERCWDRRLQDTILEKIQSDSDLEPEALTELFEPLLARGNSNAVKFALTHFTDPLPTDAVQREKATHVAALLLVYCGDDGWKQIKPIFNRDTEFGNNVITTVATRYERLRRSKVAGALTADSLADLYMWITRQFPYAEDPRIEGAHGVSPRESIAIFRDGLLRTLREMGTSESYENLRSIAEALASVEGMDWLRYTVIDARQIAMRKSWRGHEPRSILALAQDAEHRFVESGQQLLEVVCRSLASLEDKLQRQSTPAVDDLWNDDRTPKKEAHLSDYVKRHLEEDLKGNRIVANREVEIRTGQEADICVDAVEPGSDDFVTVIVEAKGCWNRELTTAMEKQLRERYMIQNGLSHGIYLVGWFLCDEWDEKDYRKSHTPKWSMDEAREFFHRQANDLSEPPIEIRAFVLDARIAKR